MSLRLTNTIMKIRTSLIHFPLFLIRAITWSMNMLAEYLANFGRFNPSLYLFHRHKGIDFPYWLIDAFVK